MNALSAKREFESEMGNLQETIKLISPEEWAWTAGIIDGEGSVTMNIRTKKDAKWKGFGIDLKVCVGNTDAGIINKFISICNRIGINPFVNEVLPNENSHSLLKKTIVYATIGKMAHIYRFLSGVTPHLASEKKERAKLIMSFIERRKVYQGERTTKGASWYTDDDWNLVSDFYAHAKKELPQEFVRFLRDYTPLPHQQAV